MLSGTYQCNNADHDELHKDLGKEENSLCARAGCCGRASDRKVGARRLPAPRGRPHATVRESAVSDVGARHQVITKQR